MDSLLTASKSNSHCVTITNTFKSSAKLASDDALRKIYDNFIHPINKTSILAGLPGKYKPSWAADFYKSPMQLGLAKAAKVEQAHHYHIGHISYCTGKDPHYPGMVSNAIIHTKIIQISADRLKHRLVFFDDEHPNPFRCPLSAYTDSTDLIP